VRLGKAKQSDRVDPIIALAMAALACVQAGNGAGRVDHAFQARAIDTFRSQTAQRTNRGFDYVQPETDRLYARGQDVACSRGRRRSAGTKLLAVEMEVVLIHVSKLDDYLSRVPGAKSALSVTLDPGRSCLVTATLTDLFRNSE
jgi:hypothetical protein